MTASTCKQVEELITRRASGLSEAEELVLEEHIAGCPWCRNESGVMQALRDVSRDVPTLRTDARMRAISGAIHVVREEKAREVAHPVRPKRIGVLLGSVAAAAAAAFLLVSSGEERTSNPSSKEIAAKTEQVQTKTPKIEPPQVIDATQASSLKFAHAELALEAGTRVRLVPENTLVELEHGQVLVDVDPAKGKPFTVVTKRLRVEVLGTRFTVREDSVYVEHGRVKVLSPEGQVLASELSAGATFSLGEQKQAAQERTRSQGVSAREWLGKAREALSRADTARARSLVARAEEASPHRADRAEASTLRAEADLLDRDVPGAITTYLSVAERYVDLPAGENALFAAAQLVARQKDQKRAKALFSTYLERYPRGRFADEARDRLR